MWTKCVGRIKSVVGFYIDGFRAMTVGRTLWLIILIKLFVIFVVLKLLFFPSVLGGKSDAEKSDYVLEQLVEPPKSN